MGAVQLDAALETESPPKDGPLVSRLASIPQKPCPLPWLSRLTRIVRRPAATCALMT